MLSPDDKILVIDIGGSHIKATLLDAGGKLLKDYEKLITPKPATPAAVVATIMQLAKTLQGYTKAAAGFPGFVKNGIVYTAPNLDNKSWKNIDLNKVLGDSLKCPVRVLNDADMQGLAVVSGKGFEIMITLGTGFGTAFLMDGKLLPHFELAHHPVCKNQTYDDYCGQKALDRYGKKKWNRRIQKVLVILQNVFNYDRLYIGGGNASQLTGSFADNIKIVTNLDGIHGGIKLWNEEVLSQ